MKTCETCTIYHGTPLTPRAALLAVCKGRAMCVSFHHPQDVEAVESISPAIMFRQRRVFILAGGNACRTGMGRASGLDAILPMAGNAAVPSWKMGGHSRYAGSAKPAQRQPVERMALRSVARRSPVAHGRADRAAWATVRAIRPGCAGMDRASKKRTRGLRFLSSAYGSCGGYVRQFLAPGSHDARRGGGVRLSVHKCGQHVACAERSSL